jgi:hypothetical protein
VETTLVTELDLVFIEVRHRWSDATGDQITVDSGVVRPVQERGGSADVPRNVGVEFEFEDQPGPVGPAQITRSMRKLRWLPAAKAAVCSGASSERRRERFLL